MANTYNTRVEQALELTLKADAAGYTVESYQPDSGDFYRLQFCKNIDSREEIVRRIGEEVYSWLSLMDEDLEDALREEDEDEQGE